MWCAVDPTTIPIGTPGGGVWWGAAAVVCGGVLWRWCVDGCCGGGTCGHVGGGAWRDKQRKSSSARECGGKAPQEPACEFRGAGERQFGGLSAASKNRFYLHVMVCLGEM